jgi:hypothetical protein
MHVCMSEYTLVVGSKRAAEEILSFFSEDWGFFCFSAAVLIVGWSLPGVGSGATWSLRELLFFFPGGGDI